MNVASLELSRELYELSGWNGALMSWKPIGFFGHSGGTYGIRQGDFELATGFYEDIETGEEVEMQPAYDLGYLLRKLPRHITKKRNYHLTLMNGNENDDNWIADYFSLTGGAWYSVDVLKMEAKLTEADTPEDALAKLAIELLKAGALQKEPS